MEETTSRPILSLNRQKTASPTVDSSSTGTVKGEIVIKGSRLKRPRVAVERKEAESALPVAVQAGKPASPGKPKKQKRAKVKVADADKVVFLSVDEIRSLCISKWPALFDVERGLIPLKVGIHKDILAELKAEGLAASRQAINKFLRAHCRTQAYLAMLQNAPDSVRWGLYGETSELSEKARVYSPTEKARSYTLTEEARAYSARKAKWLRER